MKQFIDMLSARFRYLVAFASLAIAFILSVQFGERGVQFDLNQSSLSASKSASEETYSLSERKIINKALIRINDNYVEPDRVEPTKMLTAGLDELQSQLPAVVAHYKPPKSPQKVVVEVDDHSKEFEIGSLESPWDMSFELRSIFRFVETHTKPQRGQTFRDVEYAVINGMLSALDPHSTLLTPEHYKEMQTQTGGEFGGLGIVISIRDGQLTVISPIEGTPAAAKGIRAHDKIVRIEDESTINMNLNEAVNMLRGKPGTKVDIWVDRDEWNEPRKFTIERDKITIKSVNSEPLGDKVGYVRIKNFQANTVSDLKDHLSKLKEKMGGMQGLVLDLRDDPGGLLDQAIKVSDLFLKKGTIVSTVGAGNKMREKEVATKSGTEPNYPITVLVNAGSASASEIVAGALQNHDRALVVGDRTFGKGTVQVMYEFQDKSALKLTVAQYLTPGGVSIQSRGITPDLRLIPARVSDGRANMFLSDNILREDDLQSHLSTKAAGVAKDEGVVFLRYFKEQKQNEKGEGKEDFEDPNAFKSDFQIELAQQLLTAASAKSDRKKLLEALQPELEQIYDRELAKIQKKLQEVGIDWADGSSPKNASIDFEMSTKHDGDVIRAGDKVTLEATLKNTGDSPLYRLKAISDSANMALDDREFLFGRVDPGNAVTRKLDVKFPEDTETRHDLVSLEISDDEHTYGEPRTHAVEVAGKKRPKFAFRYALDDANGDGIFQVGETVTMKTFARNVGGADSKETILRLKNDSGDAIYLEKGRAKIESIPKGAVKPVEFKFRVKEPPEEDTVALQVDIFDQTFREITQKRFEVPFSKNGGEVESVEGRATIEKGPAKLFVAASTNADTIATAESGGEFPLVAKFGDWLKLDLDRQKGWIQKSYVAVDEGASAQPDGDNLTWKRFEAPTIDLQPEERITDSKEVTVEGEIFDNESAKDYYVFVYHREDASKIESRKIAYERIGAKSKEVEFEAHLFEGMNRISVVARDDDEMTTRENIYVHRK